MFITKHPYRFDDRGDRHTGVPKIVIFKDFKIISGSPRANADKKLPDLRFSEAYKKNYRRNKKVTAVFSFYRLELEG